jgi:DNA-binding response OmpR family regulator
MKKKVLIIEDEDALRIALQISLNESGFDVYGAGNVAAAQRLAGQLWEELDVVILDMELGDPQEPRTTGADIGIEFRQKKSAFPPESLIYSARNEVDYYRLALKLGAAVYLAKEETALPSVVQHVRALALRRALNGQNPKVVAKVAQIAGESRSVAEAVMAFCRRVLKPEFESCLGGVHFVILFSEGETTRNCADNAGLPEEASPLYHTVQALAHGGGDLPTPFIFSASRLGVSADPESVRLYEKLDQAAFFPLTLLNDIKLSIGILGGDGRVEAADAGALCRLLAHYLRATILDSLINLWSRWSEFKTRAVRTNTAKLCLFVGQEIRDSLEPLKVDQLELLAEDLRDTGELLIQLENGGLNEAVKTLSMKEVVLTTWDWVARSVPQPPPKLDLRGDCTVEAKRSDLELIVSRVLQWFAYRRAATSPGVDPLIRIDCEAVADVATVLIEDNSPRLHKRLRIELFTPFTQAISTPFGGVETGAGAVSATGADAEQNAGLSRGRYLPLYLAKMLVEGRYDGLLQDCSDEIEDRSYGHRILIRFPKHVSTSIVQADRGSSASE